MKKHLQLSLTILALAVGKISAQNVNWTGGAISNGWSEVGNWTNTTAAVAHVPTDTNVVSFSAVVVASPPNVAGVVNNVVDANYTIRGVSYVEDAAHAHTTLINPGMTLTLSNLPAVAGNLIAMGNVTTDNSAQLSWTIIGTNGAQLVLGDVTTPDVLDQVVISERFNSTTPFTQRGTLDMGKLDTFSFGGGILQIGSNPSGGKDWPRGRVILARTNLIVAINTTTPSIKVGHLAGSGTGGDGELQLGQSNAIFTASMRIGSARASVGKMQFQTGLSNPALFLRGPDGVSASTTIGIGDSVDQNVNVNATATGTVDLTGGTVDVLVNDLIVGRNLSNVANSTGHGNGTLTWTAGSIEAGNLSVGSQAGNNRGNATGVVNVRSGAALRVNNLSIGADLGSNTGTANGTLNIANGGQVTVTNSILEESATVTGASQLNITNGSLTVGGRVRVDTLVASGATLNLTVGPGISAANPVCNVTNLTLISSVTLNVSGSNLGLAQYPLIKYMGTIAGDGFPVVTLSTQPASTSGYLFNNVANRSIDLVVTNIPAAKWNGNVSGDWDINTTTNWISSITSLPLTYKENTIPGDLVIFDDSATGTKTVNLTTTLSPTAVIVNNGTAYSFVGGGQISGSASLTKSGAGVLEIANGGGNTYSGSTSVGGGNLRVNSLLGGGGSVLVQSSGTLSGTGTITGPVTIGGAGTLAPGVGIGTLNVFNTLSLDATSTNVFQLNTDTLERDAVVGMSTVTYGGTLVISMTGGNTAITNGAAFQIFSAGTYAGSFASIVPLYPAPGFSWDLSTFTSDGTLRVFAVPTGTLLAWTNNTGGNLLWSNPANWIRTNPLYAGSLGGNSIPTPIDTVNFGTAGDGAFGATNVLGAVNNIVDTDFTITNLSYFQVAPSYHTTLINPGATLSVQDPVGAGQLFGLRAGALPPDTIMYTTIRGGGRLVVGDTNLINPSETIRINGASVTPGIYWSTMDMTDLNYFECSVGEVRIGATGSSAGTQGTWIMARTNFVILGSTTVASGGTGGFTIGVTTAATDFPSAGDVQLGQDNTLRLAILRVGGPQATNGSLGGPGGGIGGASLAGAGGTMEFRSGLVAPVLKVRGIDGFSPADLVGVGDNSPTRVSVSTNTATGVLDLTGGTVDALVNNLVVGRNVNASGSSSTRGGSGNGALTWTSGKITATTVTIGAQTGNNLGNATGVVNVRSNAVLEVMDSISIGDDGGAATGTGAGTLNIVNGGVVSVANLVVENTPGAQNGRSTLNLTNGYLAVNGGITVDTVNAISGVISNAGMLTAGTLRGSGTISGAVLVNTNLAPGASVGTLSIFNDLTLGTTADSVMEINLDTATGDKVVGLNNVTFGGTLTVTNVGGLAAATNGATFQFFSAANYIGTFAATNLPALGAGYAWDTSGLTNGTLRLVVSVSAVPTNLGFSVVGNQFNVSWPTDHIGWRLEAQTNNGSAGLSTNWFTVPGSTATNLLAFPINAANGSVFYRLVYP